MADKRLPELTAGSAVGGTDLFLSRQGSDTADKKVTATQLKTFIVPVQTFGFAINVEGPTNKTYTVVYQIPFAGTVTTTKTISSSGTATATFKINSTGLGGGANSVTSSGDSVSHSSANTFVAGDKIVVTISANASCIDFSGQVTFTRTLA